MGKAVPPYHAERHALRRGDIGYPAGVGGGEGEIVEGIFRSFRVGYHRAAAVGDDREGHAAPRSEFEKGSERGGKPVDDAVSLHRLAAHPEIERQVHDGKIAEGVVVSSARHAVKDDLVRSLFAGEIDGGFAVREIFVRVVGQHRDIRGEPARRVAVAHEQVGTHGAGGVSSVAADDEVRRFGRSEGQSAVEIYRRFHSSPSSSLSS